MKKIFFKLIHLSRFFSRRNWLKSLRRKKRKLYIKSAVIFAMPSEVQVFFFRDTDKNSHWYHTIPLWEKILILKSYKIFVYFSNAQNSFQQILSIKFSIEFNSTLFVHNFKTTKSECLFYRWSFLYSHKKNSALFSNLKVVTLFLHSSLIVELIFRLKMFNKICL